MSYIPNDYQNFIALSRYARWIEEKNRRETWEETVDRYVSFFDKHFPHYPKEEIRDVILNLKVMPSMRAMMTAGKALEKCNVAAYNCSYIPVDHPRAFDETLYILMSGTGAGFSVERQYIAKLPSIPEKLYDTDTVIVVDDSRIGWAKALKELISLLYAGQIPKWDTSKLRPAGARLKTFGGRSSGPEPLVELFQFVVKTFKKAEGRKLTSLECHDIMCTIASVVVAGGTRRCLPENSPVATTAGNVRIKDLRLGDIVISGNETGKVVAKEFTGEKKTLTLKHRFGEISCTPEHRVAVFSAIGEYAFKEAGDIEIGDRLVWDAYGFDGQDIPLPESEYVKHFNARENVRFPKKMTEPLAWLIGFIHGDGYVSEQTLEITETSKDLEALEYAQDVLEKEFGVRGRIGPGKGECLRLRIHSVEVSQWFYKHIKQPNVPIKIPDFIGYGKRSIRQAYLAGLYDSDGRTRKDEVIEQVTTIYPSFRTEIIECLAGLGIGCSTYVGSAQLARSRGGKNKDFYSIHVVGNTNRKEWLNTVGKYINSTKKPSEYVGKSPFDFSYPNSFVGSKVHRKSGNVTLGFIGEENHESKLYPSPVLAIEESQILPTWDIEVEGISRFTTCGILVHNSALISLSNLSDDRMRNAKNGAWWEYEPQRALANNSVAYTEKPEMQMFMREWLTLKESGSGERGLFNRVAATKKAQENGRRDVTGFEYGLNPCGEIILRPNQFCNLSETVVRETDTLEELKEKVRISTIIGTYQSILTDFKYLRPIWKRNCEEERLLGVSLTGIQDHAVLGRMVTDAYGFKNVQEGLKEMRQVAIDTNKEWAEKLGINQSVAITTVKPSGSVSQLVDSASGIHARFSKYYIRRVRNDNKNPITPFLRDSGVPVEIDVMNPNASVFSFPQKAPESATLVEDMTAIEQLEHYLVFRREWCEHNPSITVYIREDEWMEVGAWVYKHFDELGGVSFLPKTDHIYKQAPYEEIKEEEYIKLVEQMPKIDWDRLSEYELEDNVENTKELACVSGVCEI